MHLKCFFFSIFIIFERYRDTTESFICLFTFQMPMIATARPGEREEPGFQSIVDTELASRNSSTELSSVSSQAMHYQKFGSEAEKPRLELCIPMWYADILNVICFYCFMTPFNKQWGLPFPSPSFLPSPLFSPQVL